MSDDALTKRSATVERETSETRIALTHDLDGGRRELVVPNGFFHHMLDALSRHAGVGLVLDVEGDTHIDLHHTVEDTGIALGEALERALGQKAGVKRFAHAYAPLDESLARAVVDLSGRGYLVLEMPEELRQSWVTQEFPLSLIEDFFQAFADRGRLTLHLDVVRGRNPHHVAEACFKAVALALREAITRREGDGSVPSTKGTLSS